uniref:Uncharacterized protein n=1 Tax=Panagrolaimus superbus TaxID=310955 RepID=A0A914YCX2_9BILA
MCGLNNDSAGSGHSFTGIKRKSVRTGANGERENVLLPRSSTVGRNECEEAVEIATRNEGEEAKNEGEEAVEIATRNECEEARNKGEEAMEINTRQSLTTKRSRKRKHELSPGIPAKKKKTEPRVIIGKRRRELLHSRDNRKRLKCPASRSASCSRFITTSSSSSSSFTLSTSNLRNRNVALHSSPSPSPPR